MELRHPSVILLEALLEGQPIHLPDDDHEYLYVDGAFGVPATKTDTKTGQTEEVLLKVDLDLANFIRSCEKLPFKDVYLIGCGTVLRRLNRRKAEKRSNV